MPLDDGKLRDIMDEMHKTLMKKNCLLYTSDAADE